MHSPRALVRRPGPLLAEGELTHLERTPVDLDLARRQWEGYVAALQGAGWETIEVAPADDCPDAVFIEDPVVVYGDLAVIARSGAPSRRGETSAVEDAVRDLGYRVAHIEEPGTLDGGDVLKHDGTVYVGLGGRTNGAAIHQLADHLRPLGARVQAVPVTRALHLKSAVTALPDGTVIGWPPVVDDAEAFPRFRAVAGGARLARRPPRRRAPAPRGERGPHRSDAALGGLRRDRGRHLRVREDGGLRHLPVGPAAGLSLPVRILGAPGVRWTGPVSTRHTASRASLASPASLPRRGLTPAAPRRGVLVSRLSPDETTKA